MNKHRRQPTTIGNRLTVEEVERRLRDAKDDLDEPLIPPDKPALTDDQRTVVAAVLDGKYRQIYWAGVVGTAKTTGAVIAILAHSTQQSGQAYLIAGHSQASAEDNLLPPMERFSKAITGHEAKKTTPHGRTIVKVGKNSFRFVGAGQDGDEKRIQGGNVAGAVLDEAVNLTEKFRSEVLRRIRDPKIKNRVIIYTTNPGSPASWLKHLYDRTADGESPRDLALFSAWRSNPHLDDEYYDMLEQTMTGAARERYINGVWTAEGDLVYPDWKLIDEDYPTEDDGRPLATWGVDWGPNGTTAALQLVPIPGTRPARYSLQNSYVHRADLDGVLSQEEHILRMVAKLGTAKQVVVDRSARVLYDAMYQHGMGGALITGSHKDVDRGLERLKWGLELGVIVVHRRNEYVISELRSYVWDEFGRRPIKQFDHAMDALRYGSWGLLERLSSLGAVAIVGPGG